MYSRNRIYINSLEQEKIKHSKIFIAGCGLGSLIAECALRMGIETICIIDGDRVELSNLNRQNYLLEDIGKMKAERLQKRLAGINPNANIIFKPYFITENNIQDLNIDQYDIAINTLDFSSKIPFLFDEFCVAHKVPVIHPYNLGWAGLVYIINERSEPLSSIIHTSGGVELQIVQFFLKQLRASGTHQEWINHALIMYVEEKKQLPPPQLSVGSYIVAGICTSLIQSIVTEQHFKLFPDYYFLSTR